MASLRTLMRSPFYQQIFSKGLSTEAAVAYQPSKIALRSSENDPTNQRKEDIGKLYTMPDNVKQKLFQKYELPVYFERLCDTFHETNIVIRPPALELIGYLKKADYDRPIIRYVIYGRHGCGKTVTLIHALNYAVNNDFVVVYVGSVSKWLHWPKEVVSVDREPGLIDIPLHAGTWLKDFERINSQLIAKLDLRVSKTYEWTQREKTSEGASLMDLVVFGINRVKYACQVIDALLYELKLHSTNKSCKTFVAIDGFNAFLQDTTRWWTPEKVRVLPANVSLTKSFLSFIKNDWNNGAAVLIADPLACVPGVYTNHFPFHLLRKRGVEIIDPFIPINVTEYSPLEFNNYLDYLEEKRWLQRPEGRDEIDFVTMRNPRSVTTYCATR